MNKRVLFENWIIGYDPNMAHQYIIHTEFPKFICRIDSEIIASDEEYYFDLGDKWILRAFQWIDPEPADKEELLTLMKGARSARATFNFVDAGILD